MTEVKSRQELFDTAVIGIFGQGRLAMSEGQCLYRAPDGTKCAVGWNMPDEEYKDSLEGLGVSNSNEVPPAAGVHIKDVPFMAQVQDAHDQLWRVQTDKGPEAALETLYWCYVTLANVYALNPRPLKRAYDEWRTRLAEQKLEAEAVA